MKLKILLIVPNLEAGGSEKNIVWLFQKMIQSGNYNVRLCVLGQIGVKYEYLGKSDNVIVFGQEKISRSISIILNVIKKEEPYIVFSTLGHLNLLLTILKCFRFIKCKLVIRESSIVSRLNKEYRFSMIWDLMYLIFYRKADRIIAQSSDMREDLIKNYYLNSESIFIIANPVIPNLSLSVKNLNQMKSRYLVYVGRLSKEKNVDFILRSFALIKDASLELFIVGNGNQNDYLVTLAMTLGISHRVKFLGFITDPRDLIRQADALLLASSYEGFPNVVLESMSMHTAVVAVKSIGGLNDLKIYFEEEIVLVKRDCLEFANAIEDALKKVNLRFCGLQLFNEDLIFEKYVKILS